MNKLKKIIEFAVEREYQPFKTLDIKYCIKIEVFGKRVLFSFQNMGKVEIVKKGTNDILFSHDFAKAVFGEQITLNKMSRMPDWKFHLQQAVTSKDPIEYYYKFVRKQKERKNE